MRCAASSVSHGLNERVTLVCATHHLGTSRFEATNQPLAGCGQCHCTAFGTTLSHLIELVAESCICYLSHELHVFNQAGTFTCSCAFGHSMSVRSIPHTRHKQILHIHLVQSLSCVDRLRAGLHVKRAAIVSCNNFEQ